MLKPSGSQDLKSRMQLLKTAWKQITIEQLLLLWGWALFLNCLRFFMVRMVSMSYLTCKMLEYFTNGLVMVVLVWTIFAAIQNKKQWLHQPYCQIVAAWLGCVFLQTAFYVIQIQIFNHVIFELQHTLFMLLSSVAVLLTGLALKNKWMYVGGIIFILLTFVSALFSLKYQMGLEALGWFAGLVIPGYHGLKIARKPEK